MERRFIPVVLAFSFLISLIPSGIFTVKVSAAEATYEYTYTGYTGESTGILDSELIEDLKNTFFQPVVEDGTIINGGTPQGLIVLDVDTDTRYQYMEGFGASGCWVGPNSDLFDEEALNKALLLLYSEDCGIGLVGYRHNVGGGNTAPFMDPKSETVCIEVSPGVYDTSVDAVNMNMLKKVAELGVRNIGLIYYSPPARMTHSGNTAGNPNPGTNLKDEYFDDFAEYVVGTARAIQAEGISIKYISPFNEPAWGGSGFINTYDGVAQEGCYYTPDQVYQLTEMIAQVMEDKNATFGIAAAESPWWSFTGYTTELFARYLENPLIMRNLDHFCAHSYENSAEQKESIADIFLAHPEVPLHQTEECRGNSAFLNTEMLETSRQAALFHEDLTILNISEWDYWVAIAPKTVDKAGSGGGLLNITSTGEVRTPKRFFVTGQYSKFVTGMTRVEMTMPEDESLYGTAYISEDEQTITLVINNYHPDSKLISFQGLEGMMAKAYQTSDQYNLQYIGDVDATYGYEVPALSVTTLVFNKSDKTGAYGEPTVEEEKPPVDDEPVDVEPTIPEGAEIVKLDISIGANYDVTPRVSKLIKGADQTFTITPKTGYAVYSVTVNGEIVKVNENNQFTLTQLSEDTEIKIKVYKTDQFTLYPLLDFENFETGSNLIGTEGIRYTNTNGEENFTIQAHSNEIQSGQSLMFKYGSKNASCSVQFAMGGEMGFSNWGGAEEIWAYVDTSQVSGQVGFQMGFVAQYYDRSEAKNEYNLFWFDSSEAHTQEFSYYIVGEDGEWVYTDSTRWGRALLPEGYKGWIRFPLYNFVSDQDRPTLHLYNVLNISFAFNMETISGTAPAPVFIDTVSLLIDTVSVNFREEGRPTETVTVKVGTADDVELSAPSAPDVTPTEPAPTDPAASEPQPTEPSAATDKSSPTWIIVAVIVAVTVGTVVLILLPKPKKKT